MTKTEEGGDTKPGGLELLSQDKTVTSVQKPARPRKKLIIQLFVIGLFILFGSVLVGNKYDLFGSQAEQSGFPKDANSVFRDMIYESLHTFSVTEQRLLRDRDGKLVLREFVTYDTSDIRNVRTFTVTETYENDDDTPDKKMVVLSTPSGVWVRLEIFPGFEYTENWFRIDGSPLADRLLEIVKFPLDIDPTNYKVQQFGIYLPGIYEHNTRFRINSFINNKQVYQYFSDDFEQATGEHGGAYYVYKITEDLQKLVELNLLVEKELGLSNSLRALGGAGDLDGKMSFWVNKDTKRLDRIDMTFKNGTTQTIYYYDYNKPTNIGDYGN